MIEQSVDLLLALVLSLLWRRRLQPAGTVFWLYVLLYSVARGMIEFWRGDVHRGLYFGDRISTSQILALGGVVLALTILARARSAAHRTDPE